MRLATRHPELTGLALGVLFVAAVFCAAEAIAHTWHPFESHAASDAPPPASAQPFTASDAGSDEGRGR